MRIFLIAIIVFVSGYTYAQWNNISNSISYEIRCFANKGNNIFAGTFGNGIYVTSNNGDNWVERNNGLDNYAKTVYSLFVKDSYIFAGSYGGLYISGNDGLSWSRLAYLQTYSFCLFNNILFIGVQGDHTIYYSTNNGQNWIQSDNGITTSLSTNQIKVKGNYLYARALSDLYKSNSSGSHWNKITFFDNLQVTAISVIGDNIFVGTNYGGMFISTDDGLNWSAINNGINNTRINTIEVSGTYTFIGTDNYYSSGGVYVSTNYGTSWIAKNQGMTNYNGVYRLFSTQTSIFAVTGGSLIRNWRRSFSEIINVNSNTSSNPSSYILSQNFPNPFNPKTIIKFSIPYSSFVNLTVYDALGSVIGTLVAEKKRAGTYEAEFNASAIPSGVYYYRLTAEGFSETRKMVVIK